ncbi:MAG: CinA family protein [Burkholderiales bacterium]|jgi:nicotinamide-nucleotide amidase|nr:CinA family protein [Burkholderiales bacterium]
MTDVAHRLYTLAERLGGLLHAQRLVLATAESCTAGGIGFAVTQTPGSSAWYDRGYITYSNESKQQMLGVPGKYLAAYGAVSEPVARAMALGALAHGHAQIAVAVTGIAGPDGGSADKPVGTVCFAWAMQRDPAGAPWAKTAALHFDGDRAAVRTQTIVAALEGLIDLLVERQDV